MNANVVVIEVSPEDWELLKDDPLKIINPEEI
jgi:hypothetical protein